MRKLIVLLTALYLLGLAPAAVAAPLPAKKFSSCKALNKVYPNGVTFSSAAARRAVTDGWRKPSVNARVFQANVRLDRDGDGVACPREAEYEGGEELDNYFDRALCDRLAGSTPRDQMPAFCAPFGYSGQP